MKKKLSALAVLFVLALTVVSAGSVQKVNIQRQYFDFTAVRCKLGQSCGGGTPDPIRIDPIGDSKVALAQPTANFGAGQWTMLNDKAWAKDRVYVRFDLGDLQTVSQATYKAAVYWTGNEAVGSVIQAWYCPDHDFDEIGINWNNQVFDGSCSLADTFIVPNLVVYGSPQTWHEFDLTDEVNTEIQQDGQFTLVLKHDTEDGINNNRYIQYMSKDYYEPYAAHLEVS